LRGNNIKPTQHSASFSQTCHTMKSCGSSGCGSGA